MNISAVAKVLGKVLFWEGLLMILPLLVSLFSLEYNTVRVFLICIIACVVIGSALMQIKVSTDKIHLREGYVITALSWIFMSILGAIPFVLTGVLPSFIDALFETVSGFTTTGASVIPDVTVMPNGLMFWRSFTHWIGGMGVLVFVLAITSLKDGSGTNILKAESPGPQVDKLVPRGQSSAKILYGIYIVMTILQIILLLIGDVGFLDSCNISFGTAGTGGFGVRNDSMASFSPYVQNVTTLFMILYGVNFSFYFLILMGKFNRAFVIEEVKWYIIIIVSAVLVIATNCRDLFANWEETFRHSFFQVGTVITTTGYSTTDFNLWPQLSRTILVILMFIGACAGSTGGGIKVSRIVMLCKTMRKEVKSLIHPQQVSKIKMDKKTIPHEVVRSVNVYMVAYFLVFAASVLLLSIENYDLVTNFTAVVATLNNIGPGLEGVGPISNYLFWTGGTKLVLIFDMLAGRLELFPILMLFARSTWKKF